MRIVVALGGNALLRRGEPMTTEVQRHNVGIAARALAPLAQGNELVITHGNGPQIGLLALQDAAYDPDENAPLDVLGAQTDGMIGYMIEQELGNLLPFEVPFATLLTMVEVDPNDPAFQKPTKFVGPVYEKAEADRIAAEKKWVFKQDGGKWRRVVPSPVPKRIFEVRPVRWLLERKVIVICAGGGGIPTMYQPGADRKLVGVEAVVDKDACTELLAREIGAELFVMATDAEAVFVDFGKPTQRGIHRANPAELSKLSFPAGSMGPKVEAACHFAATTGHTAAIGSLADIPAIARGEKGTLVDRNFIGLSYH
ncbi:MAG TPA: carbamate kinase [Myxococcota bacterium]|nr:carbamate kinase [Myxococcota bacterium]